MPTHPHRRQTLLAVAIAGLALLTEGAHCTEECPPGGPRSVPVPPLELSLEGPALLSLAPPQAQTLSLAATLSSYDTCVLHVDASRPVVVAFDQSRKGTPPREIAVVEGAPVAVPCTGPSLTMAERAADWSAIVFRPKTPEPGPWQLKVRLELTESVGYGNDPIHGQCLGPITPQLRSNFRLEPAAAMAADAGADAAR